MVITANKYKANVVFLYHDATLGWYDVRFYIVDGENVTNVELGNVTFSSSLLRVRSNM